MSKWMWIIAGPNGAGKSTFVQSLVQETSFNKLIRLNADERTKELRAEHPRTPEPTLNLRAARDIDAEVERCIAAGRSFLVETVLSSDKYRDDVETAKTLGYKIGLIYISLHPPSLSPLRVEERVKKGGHAVDRMKAIDRYRRSHAQLAWFAKQADALSVYDNSGIGSPELIAYRDGADGPLVLTRARIPAVDAALSPPPRKPLRKRSS